MNKIVKLSKKIKEFKDSKDIKDSKEFRCLKFLRFLNLFVLAFALAFSSCTDYLDVRPENQMLLEEFWQQESDVEAVLLACYRAMQEDDFMHRVIVWGELRSDNVTVRQGSDWDAERQVENVNILTNNTNCEWGAFYKVINYCNVLLKYAPDVEERDPNFTAGDRQAKEAEALAIRALCYFYLVRTFRDVPLSIEATISDDQILQIPQSPPDEVLKRITDDLLQAEKDALSEYALTSENKGRMTKDAIRALLADVYLWQKEYAKCVEYCDKLIDATTTFGSIYGPQMEMPKYELIEEDASQELFFSGNASESIFELQFSTEKKSDRMVSLYGDVDDVGHLVATRRYAEEEIPFPQTDERKGDFIVLSSEAQSEYRIFKYIGLRLGEYMYGYAASPVNWIFYRITDVMLMKAEALVQLNRSEDDLKNALYIVNTTYMRSNPTLLETDSLVFENYANVLAMEKLVLQERQRELMFEGKRWFDLVRLAERKNSTEELVSHVLNKYTSNVSTINSKLSVMNAIYLPIHAAELKVNPLLKQNPYYETSQSIERN
jgi:hypothetical protein